MPHTNTYALPVHAPLRDVQIVSAEAPLPPLREEGRGGEGEKGRRGEGEVDGAAESVSLSPLLPFSPSPPLPLSPSSLLPASPREDAGAAVRQKEMEEVRRTLDAMREAVGRLEEERRLQQDQWRKSAIELAMALATRLLHDRITSGDYPFENVIREMIGEMTGEGPFTIYLHPDDLHALMARMEMRSGGEGERGRRGEGEQEPNASHGLLSPSPPLPFSPSSASPLLVTTEGYILAADPSMGRGDCRIETEEGTTLSQLAIQLDELRRQLLHGLGHAHA